MLIGLIVLPSARIRIEGAKKITMNYSIPFVYKVFPEPLSDMSHHFLCHPFICRWKSSCFFPVLHEGAIVVNGALKARGLEKATGRIPQTHTAQLRLRETALRWWMLVIPPWLPPVECKLQGWTREKNVHHFIIDVLGKLCYQLLADIKKHYIKIPPFRSVSK